MTDGRAVAGWVGEFFPPWVARVGNLPLFGFGTSEFPYPSSEIQGILLKVIWPRIIRSPGANLRKEIRGRWEAQTII